MVCCATPLRYGVTVTIPEAPLLISARNRLRTKILWLTSCEAASGVFKFQSTFEGVLTPVAPVSHCTSPACQRDSKPSENPPKMVTGFADTVLNCAIVEIGNGKSAMTQALSTRS